MGLSRDEGCSLVPAHPGVPIDGLGFELNVSHGGTMVGPWWVLGGHPRDGELQEEGGHCFIPIPASPSSQLLPMSSAANIGLGLQWLFPPVSFPWVFINRDRLWMHLLGHGVSLGPPDLGLGLLQDPLAPISALIPFPLLLLLLPLSCSPDPDPAPTAPILILSPSPCSCFCSCPSSSCFHQPEPVLSPTDLPPPTLLLLPLLLLLLA